MGYGDEIFDQLADMGLYPRFDVSLSRLDDMGYSGFNLSRYDLEDLKNTLESLATSEMLKYGFSEFDQESFEEPAIRNYMLIRAIATTNLRNVQRALALGAQPNEPSLYRGKRYTPLVLAAQNGSLAVVRALVDVGADVNCATMGGETAIGMASYFDNYELAEYLLKRGANPNAIAHGGLTPLAMAENVRMVELLLQYGADPNIPDNDGDLPIIARIDNYDRDSVKALMRAGTDMDHRNRNGISARAYKARFGM